MGGRAHGFGLFFAVFPGTLMGNWIGIGASGTTNAIRDVGIAGSSLLHYATALSLAHISEQNYLVLETESLYSFALH